MISLINRLRVVGKMAYINFDSSELSHGRTSSGIFFSFQSINLSLYVNICDIY